MRLTCDTGHDLTRDSDYRYTCVVCDATAKRKNRISSVGFGDEVGALFAMTESETNPRDATQRAHHTFFIDPHSFVRAERPCGNGPTIMATTVTTTTTTRLLLEQATDVLCIESVLAGFASIDVLLFFTSRVLASPQVVDHVLHRAFGSETATFDVDLDMISVSIERAGLVFLLLGLFRLHGSLHPNQKSAAQISLWSWIVELVYLGGQLSKLGYLKSSPLDGLVFLTQLAILSSIVLVSFTLGWTYILYRTKFNQTILLRKPS